jgi:hypothetical protein
MRNKEEIKKVTICQVRAVFGQFLIRPVLPTA